jgi:hypothetical protein
MDVPELLHQELVDPSDGAWLEVLDETSWTRWNCEKRPESHLNILPIA